MDDAFFGGPDGLQGRGTEKIPVYVAVSTDQKSKPQFVKIGVVDAINNQTAQEFITKAIETGCAVTTDGYTIYPQLKDLGYKHERVLFSEPEAEEKFHWVHTIITNAKALIIGTFHGLDRSICRHI